MSKSKEALAILDDLDNMAPSAQPPSTTAPNDNTNSSNPNEAADVLAFLDEITQKSSEPTRPPVVTTHPTIDRPHSRAGTPTLRKSGERVKVGAPATLGGPASTTKGLSRPSSNASLAGNGKSVGEVPAVMPSTSSSGAAGGGGGWGWGSVWTSASTVLQQARTVVDEQVKNLPNNEKAKAWREGVLDYAKNAQLDKLSRSFYLVSCVSDTLTRLSICRSGFEESRTVHVNGYFECCGSPYFGARGHSGVVEP